MFDCFLLNVLKVHEDFLKVFKFVIKTAQQWNYCLLAVNFPISNN